MKLTYRPEIDGLRAIAVGVVILYHAKLSILGYQPFRGGFIGVDIFFVISGYLITSIILKELVTTGSFSFKHFYERRVRRILPALLVVMLLSFPFAYLCLLPIDFIDYSKSILYSLGFSSNFYFHYSGQVYDAESGLLKPFLHTWSLSVEEQYYILFPVVLLITFKYFRKYLIHILIIGFIVSLGLAEYTTRHYPSASFYLIHTRMWELLVGSILAYFEIIKGSRSKIKNLNKILPFIGLILIGHSIIFFNDEIFHPSFYTLSPIIGVCLIIWFSDKDELITKILSTKLFVGIGLISYSLYLWHYPIFAFERITEFAENNIIKELFLGLIILFLSIATYYLVERPFRNKKNNFKKLVLTIIVSIIFLISISSYIIKNNGINTRLPKILQNNLQAENIHLYQKDNTHKIFLVGDSHAKALTYNLNKELKEKKISLYGFYTNIYLKDFNSIKRFTKIIDKNFLQNNNKINNFLKVNSNSIVILHHRWSRKILETHFDNEEGSREERDMAAPDYYEPIGKQTYSQIERQGYIKEGMISIINDILKQGHKLILVYPVPEMGFDVRRKLMKESIKEKLSFGKFSTPILSGSNKVFKKRNKLVFEILDSVQNSSIYRIYPHKLFCDKQIKNRCIANDKSNLFYYDDDHLSLKGSQLVVDEIIKQVDEIIKQKY